MGNQRKNPLALALCFFLLLACSLFVNPSIVKAETSAKEYAEKLCNGYNLGNIFDTGLESIVFQDEKVIEQLIKNVKKQGFTSIRIPITWEGHFDEKTYQIENEYITKVEAIIDCAVSEKMAVVLTMYGDVNEWLCDTTDIDATLAKFTGLWRQIATYLKDKNSEYVSFEAANAPFFNNKTEKEQLALLEEFGKEFVSTVRKTGGQNAERVLFVPTLNGAIFKETCESAAKVIRSCQDPLVAVAVEYYGPWSFSVNAANEQNWTKENNDTMKATIDLLDTYFIQKGTAVAIMEYGLYGYGQSMEAVNHGQVLKYLANFLYKSSACGIPTMLWDTSTIYNWKTDTWKDEKIGAYIKKARIERQAYGAVDYIYGRKGEAATDVSMQMALHDYVVTSITKDGNLLSEEDYEVKDSTLTIKASVLDSMIQKTVGETGVLQVNFSKGEPWKIHVYCYGEPMLERVSATTSRMEIPTAFAGNRLVAMEAVDEDQKSAGPLKWTTYQEYGYSFFAEYENGKIILTKEFFDAFQEEERVALTFHFESGITKQYSIIKEGNVVKAAGIMEDTAVQDTFSMDVRMLLTVMMFLTALTTVHVWVQYRKRRKREREIYFIKNEP